MARNHRIFAAVYDRLLAANERHGLSEERARLLGGLTGRVVEIGAGTGLNLAHYAGIDRLTLVEPDAAMAVRLRRRLAEARPDFDTDVVVGTLEELRLPDASVDAVVSTLVLCTAAPVEPLLAEVRRILKPGAAFVLVEHVRGEGRTARAQAVINPVWRRLAAGCNLNRRTMDSLRAAGFDVDGVEAWRIPAAALFGAPAIHGVARAPG